MSLEPNESPAYYAQETTLNQTKSHLKTQLSHIPPVKLLGGWGKGLGLTNVDGSGYKSISSHVRILTITMVLSFRLWGGGVGVGVRECSQGVRVFLTMCQSCDDVVGDDV